MVSLANSELFMFLKPRRTKINENLEERTMPYFIDSLLASTLPDLAGFHRF